MKKNYFIHFDHILFEKMYIFTLSVLQCDVPLFSYLPSTVSHKAGLGVNVEAAVQGERCAP